MLGFHGNVKYIAAGNRVRLVGVLLRHEQLRQLAQGLNDGLLSPSQRSSRQGKYIRFRVRWVTRLRVQQARG